MLIFIVNTIILLNNLSGTKKNKITNKRLDFLEANQQPITFRKDHKLQD